MRCICCECGILYDVKHPFDQDDESHGYCEEDFKIITHNLGYCECGCGNKTPLATKTDRGRGQIKGKHIRFIHPHQNKIICHMPKRNKKNYSFSKLGKKNPNWDGELASLEAGRSRARRKYQNIGICVICGVPAIDRHHDDGNTLNNTDSNVKILCRKCHMILDGRMKKLIKRMSKRIKYARKI